MERTRKSGAAAPGRAKEPPGEVDSLEDAIKKCNLMSDRELADLLRKCEGKEDPQSQRLAKVAAEYQVCRVLLRTALDQRRRILNWPEAKGAPLEP